MSYSNSQIAAYVKSIEDKYKAQLRQQESSYQARITDAENSRNTAISAARSAADSARSQVQTAQAAAASAESKLANIWGKISALFGISNPDLSELEKTARQYSAWSTKVPALQSELDNARADAKNQRADANDLEKAYNKLMRTIGKSATDGTGGTQSPSVYDSLLGSNNRGGGLSSNLLDTLTASAEAEKAAAASAPAPSKLPKIIAAVLLCVAIWYAYKYFKG
jgi:DNA repair exonuclease SbcCD ATPase subunit